jgi:hypothetical protein
MKFIHRLIGVAFVFSVFSVVSVAQSDCPADKVCISPEAARKALADADLVEAQKKEIDVLKQALADQKNVAADVKIELARTMGEKTRLEIEVPRLSALLEVCMKKRGVKVGLFNF